MTNVINRGYSIFYMSLTAFCIVAGVGALMAWFYPMDPYVYFGVSYTRGIGLTSRRYEETYLALNVTADFSKLVRVNTRLFYAYIEAEWEDKVKRNDEHKMVIWNQLIYRENPKVRFVDQPANFTIRQVGPPLKGKSVKLNFKFQMVPYIGFFRTATVKSIEYQLPNFYSLPPYLEEKN